MEDAKVEGNAHFKKGEFPQAIELYGKGIALFEKLENKTKISQKLALDCLNNRAACRVQIREFEDCILDCNMVLEMDSKNAKALLRRGTCYEHIEKHKLALKDMEACLGVDPNNKQAKDILNRVKKACKALYGFDGA